MVCFLIQILISLRRIHHHYCNTCSCILSIAGAPASAVHNRGDTEGVLDRAGRSVRRFWRSLRPVEEELSACRDLIQPTTCSSFPTSNMTTTSHRDRSTCADEGSRLLWINRLETASMRMWLHMDACGCCGTTDETGSVVTDNWRWEVLEDPAIHKLSPHSDLFILPGTEGHVSHPV